MRVCTPTAAGSLPEPCALGLSIESGVRRVLNAANGVVLVAALACLPIAAEAAESDDALAAQATDPTASLMSFQLNDWYTPSYHGLDDSANQVVFRAAIPFDLAGTQHIFRVTQPYATSSPAGSGLVDTVVFDLAVFNQPWGRWGVGVSGTLPTGADGLSTDK